MTRIVVLSLIAVAACARGGGDVVRFQASADGAEIAAYQGLIDAFEASHPEIDVEFVPVAGNSQHMAKLAADFAAGDPPDVFLVNYRRYGQLARNGAIEPADGYVDEIGLDLDDLYPEPVQAFRIDDTLMCLPQNISSLVIYYNRTVFQDAGVAEPPGEWTWSEFLATAKALTRDTDGDGAADVYGLATETDLVRLAPFVWQAGGNLVDDIDDPMQTTLLGDAELEAMRFFIGWRRDHKIAPSLEEAEAEDPESRFARGGAAMILESRRATANLRTVDGLDFDVAPLPHLHEHATTLHADAYCLAASSERKDAATAFIGFAMSEEGQTLLSRTGRLVPARIQVAESDAFLDPTQPPSRAQVFLDQIAFIRAMPDIAAWHEIESVAEPIIEEWYYGTEPVENLGIEIDLATRGLFAGQAP